MDKATLSHEIVSTWLDDRILSSYWHKETISVKTKPGTDRQVVTDGHKIVQNI